MLELPKLRDDVVIKRQNEGCVLKDARSGRFFRLGEMEATIAEELDGDTPLEIVQCHVEARLGAKIPDEAPQAVADLFQRLGLLEDSKASPEHRRGVRP